MADFPNPTIGRRVPRGVRPGAWAAVALLLILWAGAPARAEREYTTMLLSPPFTVLDGDTFQSDLDGDGHIEIPPERIRLLYVDTPELGDSPRSRDLAHGLPAKAFLEEALRGGSLTLLVPRDRPRGKYGRTLGLVRSGDREINLAVVRAGHSPYDTRFGWAEAHDAYADAEGEAFDAGRGIWGDSLSRRSYLHRLREEGKTPRSADNPLYGGGPYDVAEFDPTRYLGLFVRVRGSLQEREALQHNVVRLRIGPAGGTEGGTGKGLPLEVVLLPPRSWEVDTATWSPGLAVQAEGFVVRYRGRLQVVANFLQAGYTVARTAPEKRLTLAAAR